MELVCYRCNATVEPDANYCVNCGAPQIRFVPEGEASAESAADAAPLVARDAVRGGPILWKTAVPAAAGIAFAAGVLSALMAAASILWVALAGFIAIRLYRRRLPHASLARRTGARIGALVGVLSAAVALAGNGVLLIIQRYGLHQGHLLDEQLTRVVTEAANRATAMDPSAPAATFAHFWLSAEGRVGLELAAMGLLSVLILLFAIAGGLVGAHVYRSPNGRRAVL
jgi:Na+/proline symporter